MNKTKSFKELIVWQKAHKLVLEVYKTTKSFPKEEVYSLTNQFRRAGVSIAANIAEGYKKKTVAAKSNYLNISEGSLEEVKYYLILAKDLNYMSEALSDELYNDAEEVGRLLTGYSNAINKS